MKKIITASIIAASLSTNLLAEAKPYIGIGSNSFSIEGSDFINIGDTRDTGTTIGINAGAILSDKTKVNLSYFSGKESSSELLKATVLSVTYDYSFNNFGARQGFYLGAGVSSVKVAWDAQDTSASAVGLAFRYGFEYKATENILLGIGGNINTANPELSGTVPFTADVDSTDISFSYLF